MSRQTIKRAFLSTSLGAVFCLILLLSGLFKEPVFSWSFPSESEVSESQRKEAEMAPTKIPVEHASSFEDATIAHSILPWTTGNSSVKSWVLLVLFVFMNLTLLYRDDKKQRNRKKKKNAAAIFIDSDSVSEK